jgi:hypothetical protein
MKLSPISYPSIIVGYVLTVLLIALFLHPFYPLSEFDPNMLLQFDAIHYYGIMQHGYINESSAFFPLFPKIWKYTGLGIIGISVLNVIIFATSSSILCRVFKSDIRTLLLFISLPSLFFAWLPYTESMFFLGATSILIGMRREHHYLILIGLAWCTLSRPAFTALLPAMIITTVLGEHSLRCKIIRSASYISISLLGLFLVSYIQFTETGSWTGFYTAQQGYGNTFKLPNLPLTSWGGGAIVRLDSVALLLGLSCGIALTRSIYIRFTRVKYGLRPEVLLSLGYIAGVSLIALLLRGGELYSLNRFIFATPFAFVLIDHAFKNPLTFKIKQAIMILSILIIYSILYASFVHIQTFLWYFATYLYLIILMYVPSIELSKHKIKLAILLMVAVSIQVYFFQRYLNNEWVA